MTVQRLVTTREVMGKDTKNMAEAWNVWIKSGQITALRFFPSQMARKQAVAQIGAGGIGEPRAFTTAVLLSEFFEGVENYFLTNFNKA